MYFDVFISGFGGQGILLAGQLLAEAAMEKGLNVTFFPSYGVEMRGGTARCTVVISDEEIGSPIVDSPLCVIAMNQPSLLRFQKVVAEGGLLLVNSSPNVPGTLPFALWARRSSRERLDRWKAASTAWLRV